MRVAPVTASVTQLKGMLPKLDAPVTLGAMDEAMRKRLRADPEPLIGPSCGPAPTVGTIRA